MAIKKAKRKEINESNLKDFITFDKNDDIQNIDEKFFNYNNLITYEIIDDSDFMENFHNKKYKYYYLNDEQYSCLVDLPPHFIAGSAGSGKSTLTLRKLLNLEENQEFYDISKVLYLTANKYLKDNSFEQYLEFRKNNNKVGDFFTLKEFLCKFLNISPEQIVEFSKFKEFFIFSYPNRKKLDLSIEEIYSEINGIIKGLMIKGGADNWNRDLSKHCISLEDYLNLSSKYSTLDKDSRKTFYDICQKYNYWLQQNDFFDLNDLSILLLKKNLEFDFIIIDEVQDLTEVQIYMLTSLVKNKDNLFLAGDIHQMINATFFNFERIKNLFYSKYNKKVNIKVLSKNYRSCKKIVDLANYFAELRSSYIGNLGIEDYKEVSIQKDGEVNLTQVNIPLLEKAQNDANSAIVVPDNKIKSELLDQLKNKHRVFTIQEIKGLEYNNVICYNLSSTYYNQWTKIFLKSAKHDQKYRKYFNIFYVGITRAQEKLIIMESNIDDNKVLKELHNFLTPNDDVTIDIKNENTTIEKEEWLKEGIKLYKLEQLDEAQYAFEKAGEPTWILERELENLISQLNFKKAIKKLSVKTLKSKEVYYRKLIIDTAIENEQFFVAAECNRTFGISYKDKEIKEGIKKGVTENHFTQKELQKIIQFYKEKKDSNFVGDLLIKMKRFNEALIFYQNLNNSAGIRLARCGILEDYFKSLSNFESKVAELDDIITNKNINSFDKKDKLTALHRALLIKEDPILFEMILYLGGNLSTYVKGKELVPIYCLHRMDISQELKSEFLDIFLKFNFNFNDISFLPIYLKKISMFKLLINRNLLDINIFESTINELLKTKVDLPDNNLEKRKLILYKNIIKNYKNKKENL
ncbi:UvrD-helicase domain-containing protein [Candidatus Cetobacterium colombiensis]|uniref:3'-5' exonuclease n=1 Tax=Candidatus Cetobacterium colombiensis TaxID=3073100 RepID=A0ABU4W765_9FUSO|nr:UvrD-helicase domain-containing protein [Candidatus Cetobacterium colombiensis]MDX8335030.1 3'-5' exonuclease [Candidatus Cetobacterium colombiensis]